MIGCCPDNPSRTVTSVENPVFGLLERGQAEPVEQDVSELLGGVDVERCPRCLMDLRHQPLQQTFDIPGHTGEVGGVESDAGLFHVGQNLDQRKFHGRAEIKQAGLPQTCSPAADTGAASSLHPPPHTRQAVPGGHR